MRLKRSASDGSAFIRPLGFLDLKTGSGNGGCFGYGMKQREGAQQACAGRQGEFQFGR